MPRPLPFWHLGGAAPALLSPHALSFKEYSVVSIIASNVRKGNVIDKDGKLYVVLTAENFHPGKGTPTTQIEMRRISDGVKINDRYKTTDSLEKAFVDMRTNQLSLPRTATLTFSWTRRISTRCTCRPRSWATRRDICRKTWK